MNGDDQLALLPAWVRDDVSDSDDQALVRAVEADPELGRLADSLRRTQIRAAEVLLVPLPQRSTQRPPPRAEPVVDTTPPQTVRTRPGRNALYVAIAAGVLAVVLGIGIITTLAARPGLGKPPPITEQLGLVVDGSLAPLARSDLSSASKSLLTLGVPEHAAVPPDVSALGLQFVSATALPGPVPGAAFEYERDGQRFLLQTASVLTAPGGAEVTPIAGVPVSWIRSNGRWYAMWQQGPVDHAVTGTTDRPALEALVTELLALQ